MFNSECVCHPVAHGSKPPLTGIGEVYYNTQSHLAANSANGANRPIPVICVIGG